MILRLQDDLCSLAPDIEHIDGDVWLYVCTMIQNYFIAMAENLELISLLVCNAGCNLIVSCVTKNNAVRMGEELKVQK